MLACRAGQNRVFAPYLTVYLVISLPILRRIHCLYLVLANPTTSACVLMHALYLRVYVCAVFCVLMCALFFVHLL